MVLTQNSLNRLTNINSLNRLTNLNGRLATLSGSNRLSSSTTETKASVTGAVARRHLLNAGVRVPLHLRDNAKCEYSRKQTVTRGTLRTEVLTEEKWRVLY